MDELEKLFYEAMKDGNKGFSENGFYSVKLVGKRTEDKFIVKKVKIKFKEQGLKITVPMKLFLTNDELDENSVSLLASAVQVLYIPMSVCNLF